MPKLNNENAKCHVFTFYDGPSFVTGNKTLFTLGYDLKFVLPHFEILSQHKGRSIKAQFDASSLKVYSAIENHKEVLDVLPKEKKKKINDLVAGEILQSFRFRRIYFEGKATMSSDTQGTLEGELSLRGTSAKIKGQIISEGSALKAVVSLDQRHFSIKPYSAYMGLLKIKPIVKIILELPANALS